MNQKKWEQQHLTETIQLIQQEDTILRQKQAQSTQALKDDSLATKDFQIKAGSSESYYESLVEYREYEQELLLKYQTFAAQEKRLEYLKTMVNNPYFARIDFSEDDLTETLYLGISSLRDQQDQTIIIDWRAPIANLYYEGELGSTYYEANNEKLQVELLLKRQFKIRDQVLLSMADTSEVINDDFLLDILDEASTTHMKNIVSTIQKAQNTIIRDTNSKVMLIEGIAGSGKTSALLQRIAFLLYHHRKWLEIEQVLLFSPNHLFSDYISSVLPSLGESGVPTQTFDQFLRRLLPNYEILQEDKDEQTFLSGEINQIARLKTSFFFTTFIDKYSQTITQMGPIFRNLSLRGEILIPKEKIRLWYRETNPTLKMYQRMSLLQTKLLKKIGGLKKDEMRKNWVKEAVDERIDSVIMKDPQFEDTDENIRKLRKKLTKQLVEKQFQQIEKQIHQFQFINFAKQYVHLIQSVPTTVLEKENITTEEWQAGVSQLKQQLRFKQLTEEDAVLYLLLLNKLYSFEVGQQARFIFIDEMQDFTPAQVSLLRSYFPKANYTFCGDLNQKVFGNETIVATADKLFPDAEVTRYQLTTNYRSTKQITDFANHFLSQEEQVERTARHGDLPTIYYADDQLQAVNQLNNQLVELANKSAWRTAIIAKTEQECQELYQALPEAQQNNIQLIIDEDDFMKKDVLILPAFLAKGLEFDQVIGWNIQATNFSTPQDQLILYTIATRAMHTLNLINIGEKSPLLAKLASDTYQEQNQLSLS